MECSQITTYPPLSQLTILPPEQQAIPFTLIIEWKCAHPPYPFEVFLAFAPGNTTQHESQWSTIQISKSSHKRLYTLGAQDIRRAAYSGTLLRKNLAPQTSEASLSRHYLFTVKFRTNAYAPWQWISIMNGKPPGELVLQQSLGHVNHNASLLEHVHFTPDWTVKSLVNKSSTGSAPTFLAESVPVISRTSGDELSVLSLASLPSAVRHFSLVRLSSHWLDPRQGKGSFFYISEDAVVCSFLLDNGSIVTFVPLGWIDDAYQVFRSDGHGGIAVAAQNDNESDTHCRVVVSIGTNFQDTVTSAMDQARDIISSSVKVTDLRKATKDIISKIDLEPAAKSADQWLDSLSFCTWNALGQNLTQSKILTALDELQKHDIAISTLLIDDNWQTLGAITDDTSRPLDPGWADMQANTNVAPTGLKDLISTIRTRHPGIKDIGVWHALMGYWGGISPTGQIAKDYETTRIPALLMRNTPATLTTVAATALHAFYDDFYVFLRDAGVTFVKTDVQHMLSMIRDAGSRRDLVAAYQSAWTRAHLRHFGGKAISCMSQTPQTLFHGLLVQLVQDESGHELASGTTITSNTTAVTTALPKVVHRNSNDFYPDLPTSHAWHVWTNAHNAVFTRHLNVVLDWDMFQTDHDFSAYHAAARCVSGGPLLITDVPGKHDAELIRQMTAKNPAGGLVALRTAPGVAVDVFGLYTEGNMLKVRADAGAGGAVIMALFNVAEQAVRGMVHVREFELHSANEILVRAHRAGEIFGPMSLSDTEPALSTTIGSGEGGRGMAKLIHTRLDVRGWDILTAHPVHRVQVSAEEHVKVCVLGLLGKMSGAAAITASSVSVEGGKIVIHVSLKALGRLGVWFDSTPVQGSVEVRVQGSRVDDPFLQLVTLPESLGGTDGVNDTGKNGSTRYAGDPSKMQHVWEVDVEAYWKHKELWGETHQEVKIEVLIG